MTSIRQIAKLAGYAPSTVSRYLNRSGYVSKSAATKIQNVIEQLDYMPSQIARDLSQGSTKRIGVVIPHTKHPYFIEIIRGLLEASKSSNYQLLFLPSDYDLELELSYLEQLHAKTFDALIFTSRTVSLETIDSYTKYGNIVCLEPVTSKNISAVYLRRTVGYTELFTWLKDKNCDKYALLFSRNEDKSSTFTETMATFKKVLNPTDYETFGNIGSYHDGQKIFKTLCQKDFDCIIANSDELAVGIYEAYKEVNLTPPLIVSQSRQLVGKFFAIPTIEDHSFSLGKKAFETALSPAGTTISFATNFIYPTVKALKVIFKLD